MVYSLSIDPSIRSCGWAIWKGKELKEYGVFRSSTSKEKDWQKAGLQIGGLMSDKGKEWKVLRVFCEYPAFFGANATANSGALIKLSWFVGFLNGLFIPEFVEFNLIPVNTWKGQLPKHVVQERIERILPELVIKSMRKMPADVFDAVGIGLYCHGRMR